MTAPSAPRSWFDVANAVGQRLVPARADWVLLHVRAPVLDLVRSAAVSALDGSQAGPPAAGEELVVVTLRHRDSELEVTLNQLISRLQPRVGDPYGSGRVTATGTSRIASRVDPAHLRAIATDEQNLRMLEALHLGSAVVVPVVTGGTVIGALNMVRAVPDAVAGDDLVEVEAIGARIGAAFAGSLPATAALRQRPADPDAARFAPPSHEPLAAARRFVRRMMPELLRGAARPGLADDLDLVVTELCANAVRHAGGVTGVELVPRPGAVRVVVADTQDRQPVRRHPAPFEESGRGMVLVEALARRWGVDHDSDRPGKRVWAEVAV